MTDKNHITIIKDGTAKIMLVNITHLEEAISMFEDALRGHGFHFEGEVDIVRERKDVCDEILEDIAKNAVMPERTLDGDLMPLNYDECMKIINKNRDYHGMMEIDDALKEICARFGAAPQKPYLDEKKLREIIESFALAKHVPDYAWETALAREICEAYKEGKL